MHIWRVRNSIVGVEPLLYYFGLDNDGLDRNTCLNLNVRGSSDYDVVISSDDHEFEEVVNSKPRRRVEVEREALHEREDNASVGYSSEGILFI